MISLALATAAAAGAWQLLRGNKLPQLDLTPPSDVAAFVLSSYDRMPELPPMAITTLTDGSIKGRIYVDGSGAVRFEHYATPDAPQPDTYEILNGTTMGQLATVGTNKVWVEQDGAISEDPRVFLLAALEGGGAENMPGCGLTRNPGDVGDGTAALGWTYLGTEDVLGRPAFHVTCEAGELWIDVQTRLILRSRGPAQDTASVPVEGRSAPPPSQVFETIEVTDLELGDQPADLFRIAQPAGVAVMSSDTYECQIVPGGCPTPPPTQGTLPSLPPPGASNGWIAYSTDVMGTTTGSDIYLVREGGQPRVIASREGGTTRNSCPAFSPEGTRLAYGVAGPQGRDVVVLGVDADGVIDDPVSIGVPGSGPVPCPRWSSDGRRIAYVLDGDPDGTGRPTLVVRGLDGSTPAAEAGDPSLKDFDPPDALVSPSGMWTVRLVSTDAGCEMVVTKPDGPVHVFPLGYCPYAIAAWSPDGQQVLLMQDVGDGFSINAIDVDSGLAISIVSDVATHASRDWPGWGDVSWQPVFP